jgi:O-antigen/teichoic acid export membrane protein
VSVADPPETTPRRESVVRGTATVLLTYAATAAMTAVLTLYLVRALGPRDFGIFSLALGVAGLLALPMDLGIAASAARFMAERRGDRSGLAALLAAGLRLKLLVGGAVAVALVALADPVADAYREPGLVWPLRALALATLMQSMMGLFSGAFFAVGRTATNFRMVLAESAVELGASVALVAMGAGAAGAASGRAIGYVAGGLVGLGLAVRLFGRDAAAAHRRGGPRMAMMGRYALTLWLVNGAYTVFSQIDLLLIGAILTTTAVGAFSAPLRLTLLLAYPGLAVANAVSPRVARRPGEPADGRPLARALRALIVVQALMLAPLLVWAEPIVHVLLGNAYRESVGVLRVMTAFIFLQGIAPLVSLSINYLGEARRRLPYAVAAVVVNVVLDVALLRELGVVAAAIGTSVAFAVYVGGHVHLCRRLFGLELGPPAVTLARSLAAAAAMAGVLALFGTHDLTPLDWVAGLAGGTLAYGCVLVALREFRPGELRRLALLVRDGLRPGAT